MSSTRSVVVRAPAKINILLSVGDARADGFHALDTVYQAVSLYDTVRASGTPGQPLTLSLTGPESESLTADEDNLAWRAAAALAGAAGTLPWGSLTVDKQIPVAAGLAGGSADAAAALVACRALWQLPVDDERLYAIAAGLGSDVPFSLHGRTAHGGGRGEHLTPVPAPELHWVLAAAAGGLSTPAVYAELDRMRAGGAAPLPITSSATLIAALAGAGPADVAPLVGNDLQAPAIGLAGYLADTLTAGREAGALAALVSGSGPTCAFLAADAEAARAVAASLMASGRCRFALAVTGNVDGALENLQPS